MTTASMQATAFSRRGILIAGTSSILLAGCGGGLLSPSQDPLQIYLLKPSLKKFDDIPPVSWQLSVAQPDVAQSLQTSRISLQRGQTMDFYANAEWTDPTAQLLQSLLVEAFETSGGLKGVAPESEGLHADMVLETEVRSFQATYQDENGAPDAVVTISARLLAAGRGEVVGTLISTHETRAAQNSVPAVVQAFGDATGQVLEEIVRWTLKSKRA
jgi:cholesterol transport system auxiliary component